MRRQSIKETRQGKAIEFFTNPSGTLVKQGELSADGKLRIDQITSKDGSTTPPGMIPIGGMLTVMPHMTNAWQPPSSGAIKDGFMRADGSVITAQNVLDGSVFPLNTALPDMRSKYAKGGTATSGAVNGSNTITFAGTAAARSAWFGTTAVGGTYSGDSSVTVPAHTHSVTSNVTVSGASFTGTAASYTVNVPGHKHGRGNFNITGSGGHVHPITDPGHSHGTRLWQNTINGYPHQYAPTTGQMSVKQSTDSATTDISMQSADHVHATTDFTGVVGLVAGSDGDATFAASGTNTPAGTVGVTLLNTAVSVTQNSVTATGTSSGAVTMNTACNSMEKWAAAGNYTPAGTIAPSSGTAGNNEPAHVEVIWVIRVK